MEARTSSYSGETETSDLGQTRPSGAMPSSSVMPPITEIWGLAENVAEVPGADQPTEA
jgi:hypothetical protein